MTVFPCKAAEYKTLLDLATTYGWKPLGTNSPSVVKAYNVRLDDVLCLDLEKDSVSQYVGHPVYGSYFIEGSSVSCEDAQNLALCLEASRGRVPSHELRDAFIGFCARTEFEISGSEVEKALGATSWKELSRTSCVDHSGREYKIGDLFSEDDFIRREGELFVRLPALRRVANESFESICWDVRKVPPPDFPDYLRATYRIGTRKTSKIFRVANESERKEAIDGVCAEAFRSALGLQIPTLEEKKLEDYEVREPDDDEISF